MIDLRHFDKRIIEGLRYGYSKFKNENERVKSLGILASPMDGYVHLCFNSTLTLAKTKYDCHAFEFPEYRTIQIPEWRNECNLSPSRIRIDDKTLLVIDIEMEGPDRLNRVFLDYLLGIPRSIYPDEHRNQILVQIEKSGLLQKV